MDLVAPNTQFAYDDVAIKIGLSLLIGLLVGLEREWAQKEVGVRTFAIIALMGNLASFLGSSIVVVSMLGIFLAVVLLNAQSLLRDRSLELTTSAAMMAMLLLGALVGSGHFFTSAASAILLTMLLAWKMELARFADALKPEEIRGAVLLAMLTFVIHPLLPDRFIDPWGLVNPRQAWVTVVAIAGIGFVNYVLLRIYSTRGLYYAALLGGMVNSTATVTELSASFKGNGGESTQAVSLLLLTNVAMFLRNLVLLAIFSVASTASAFLPLAAMAGLSALVVWRDRAIMVPNTQPLKIGSPISLLRVLKFGALFIGLAAGATLAQRHLGNFGFLVVSVLGGIISSASTTASAAHLASTGQISPWTAGVATVLTAMSSALVNLPLVYQQARLPQLTRRLALTTGVVVGVGLLVLGVSYFLRPEGLAEIFQDLLLRASAA